MSSCSWRRRSDPGAPRRRRADPRLCPRPATYLPRPGRVCWTALWQIVAGHLAVEAFGAIRGLRSPRRLGLLIGGNLATEVLFALALGTFTRALGYPIGLGELLLVNIGVALLSGLLPVPGGIGVAEGGLTFGLVQAGMPDEIAFGAVLMYRLSTFYLPPIWGVLQSALAGAHQSPLTGQNPQMMGT